MDPNIQIFCEVGALTGHFTFIILINIKHKKFNSHYEKKDDNLP